MKKQFLLLSVFFIALVLSSCGVTTSTTNSYSGRTRKIEGGRITEQRKAAEIDVDFAHRVTARSGWQSSKSAAQAEAEHKAIIENGIDVVVQPIWKITVSPLFSQADGAPWWQYSYKAEINGFAGMYKKAYSEEEQILQMKDIDRETIEKYKLLTDPDFPKVYYNQDKQPDDNSIKGSVIIEGGTAAPASPVTLAKSTKSSVSLVVKSPSEPHPVKEINYYQRGRSKINAGKTFCTMGALCLVTAVGTGVGYGFSDYGFSEDRGAYALFVSTHAFTTFGVFFEILGGSCWAAGKRDLKRAGNPNLTFNYQVAPTGINLAFNF